MSNLITFLHYGTIAATTLFTGLGTSIGQGIVSKAALISLDRQPEAQGDITRSNLLALALIETAAILGFIFSFILFAKMPTTTYGIIGELGIAAALSIPGFTIGLLAAKPAYEALLSIARQPFLSKKIMNLLILALSLMQTPIIFGFILSFIIRGQLDTLNSFADGIRLLAAGLCLGLGSIGPIIGVSKFTKSACSGVGINQNAYARIFSFTIISQAIIETPVIFATIVGFWLATASSSFTSPLVYIALVIVMGLGTLGAGINSGKTAAVACTQIAYKPHLYSLLSRTSIIIQAFIDTSAIYAFVIALFLLLARL